MLSRTFFYAASNVAKIKQVRVQVFGRGICSKSNFLNNSASSTLGHWWLIFNHYKLAQLCFLSDLYWVELLSQTHKWVCDICFKLITKHQTSNSCNSTKHLGAIKMLLNHNKGLQQLMALQYFTGNFKHRTQYYQEIISKTCNLIHLAPATK